VLANTGNSIGKNLIEFLTKFKKGSKPFRNIMGAMRTPYEKKLVLKR
jgi:hypothetical protein